MKDFKYYYYCDNNNNNNNNNNNMTTNSVEKSNRHRVMIFDVETTGLIPKNRETMSLTEMPHILQISFVIFDTQFWSVIKSVDLYINIPLDVDISVKITELTGITREMSMNGELIHNAMREFYEEYVKCDIIVAHNIQFDREMIRIEIERLGQRDDDYKVYNNVFNTEYEKMVGKDIYCTMKYGRNICKIEQNGKNGMYYKSPKLVELYQNLFGMTPQGLHSSLIDTYVCLRCFVRMRFKFDLSLDKFPKINFIPIIPITNNVDV